MTQTQIKINDVYLPYLDCMSRTQIYYGGSASGKSVFLAQRPILDLLAGGRNYLVVREVGRTIRGSVAQELQKVIIASDLSQYFNINKTDGTITCTATGNQIIFSGLDDVEKLKSITPAKGALTDIWVEEATEASQDSIKQLIKRQRGGDEKTPKRLMLSFNPILKIHWIYKTYFESIGWTDDQTHYEGDGLSILKTTYKDNRYLTQDDIKDLLSETDEYYYNVYTLGMWGVLGDVIFKNWKVEDLSGMRNQFTNRRNGLDFGFSSDPAALVVCHYDRMRKVIYIFNELYETGLTNDILAERIQETAGSERVVCDSAEPKSIQELNNHKVMAVGAVKGKDSVNFGIDWLKQHEIIIDKSCVNMQNEMSQYHWKKDAGGNSMKTPADKNNHLIDALRYAMEGDMSGRDSAKLVDFA
jgi:phage terminase large subunit